MTLRATAFSEAIGALLLPLPPALLFVAQSDLDGIRSGTRFAIRALTAEGIPVATQILAFLDAHIGDRKGEPAPGN